VGGLTKIARENDPAPGGGTFQGGFERALNNLGVLGFIGSVDTGSASENGVFRGSGSGVTRIARQGESAPGSGDFLFFGDPAINDSNVVAFRAGLATTAGSSGDAEGIFLGDGEDVVEVVRIGQALGSGAVSAIAFAGGDNDGGGSNALNEFGQVAYQAALGDAGEAIAIFTPELHWRRSQPTGSWDARDNWTLGLAPGTPHDVFIDPDTDLDVLGPASASSIESLKLGGNAGIATLTLQEGATLSVSDTVAVRSKGILGGAGTIAGRIDVDAGGVVAPSDVLTVGDFSMDAGSILRLALDGSSAGQFGVLHVIGSVALAGDLELELSFAPSPGDAFLVLENDSLDPIAGVFSDGSIATASFGGQTYSFAIDYAGGSGNDVVLGFVPEPTMLLLLGLGAAVLRARRAAQRE
jgi:hypothetical protein